MGILNWLDPGLDNSAGNIFSGIAKGGSLFGGIVDGMRANRRDEQLPNLINQLPEYLRPTMQSISQFAPDIVPELALKQAQQNPADKYRGIAMKAINDPKLYQALMPVAQRYGFADQIDTPEKLQMFAMQGMKPEDATPSGAFAGTSMDAQIGNILVAAEQNPALKNTPQYKFAVAQYQQPRVTMGPDGRVVTIQPTLPNFGGQATMTQPMPTTLPSPASQPGLRVTQIPGANVSVTGDPTPQPIPAEQAARVAMTRSFLQQAPGILKAIKEGAMDGVGALGVQDLLNPGKLMTGLSGSFDTEMQRGPRGEIMRRLASGQDALIRNLTGAGMPAEEARRYADRYSPSSTDTRETMLSKATQLVYELKNVEQTTMSGRRLAPELATTPSAPPDQYGAGASGQGNATPLPADPAQLRPGQVYQTSRGPARFIGNGQFEAVMP